MPTRAKSANKSEVESARVPLRCLLPNPDNYNGHPAEQIEEICASLETYKQIEPLVVKRHGRDQYILSAHHGVLQAAAKLLLKDERKFAHLSEMDVVIVPDDWSDAKVRGYMLASNETSRKAVVDQQKLLSLLEEQRDLGADLRAFGSSDEELREKLEAQGDAFGGDDPFHAALPGDIAGGAAGDEFDETPKDGPTRTHAGELWQLGPHLLLVGNSRDPQTVARLLGNERVAMTFTSPPYNTAKNSSLPQKDKYIEKDDERESADYLALLREFTGIALQYSDFVFVNVQSISGNKVALIDYLSLFKQFYADTIIWDKMAAQPAMANNVMNSQFEYVHIFSQRANRVIGTKPFRGTVSNVLTLSSHQDKEYSDIIRATFPVAFAAHFIDTFTHPHAVICDPFAGAGTSMIAAHRLERRARLIEIDCRYADLIVSRYELETGMEARMVAKGEREERIYAAS